MTTDFPAGNIRVSDAERDLALSELSDHFQSGRITQEEFDERSGLALQAKTGDDLRELFTDLPTREPKARAAVSTSRDEERGTSYEGAGRRDGGLRHAGGKRGSTAAIVVACVSAFIIIGQVTSALLEDNGSHHVSVNVSWVVPAVIALIVVRRAARRR